MRVYSEIVFDATGRVLSEKYAEYDGPVAMAKGGGDNDIPETAAERAAAEIALKEWNHYQEVFVPLENKFIQDVQMGEQDYAYAGGAAVREGRKAMADASERFVKTAGANGVNVGSSRAIAGLSDASVAEGTATAKGAQSAHIGVNDAHYKGLSAAVAMGRGQAVDASLGMERVAANAAGEAISDAQNDFVDSQAWSRAIGTGAGIGLRSYQAGAGSPAVADPAASFTNNDVDRASFDSWGWQ